MINFKTRISFYRAHSGKNLKGKTETQKENIHRLLFNDVIYFNQIFLVTHFRVQPKLLC